MWTMAVHRALWGVASVLLLFGCSDALDPSRDEVASVVLDPSVSEVEQGAEVQLSATARATDGRTLPDRRIFWAAEDTSIAQISEAGALRGRRPGTTRVAASSEGKHAVATVTVRPPAVSRIVVSPSTLSLPARGSGALSVTASDARGGALTGRSVRWTSRAPEVASVEGDGTVRAVRAGTTWVVAEVESRTDSARVTVNAGPPSHLIVEAGDDQTAEVGSALPLPLTVRVVDEHGTPIPGVTVQWSTGSNGGTLAPVTAPTDAGGRASTTWTLGTRPGQFTATATVASLTATFRARANAGSARTVELTPDSVQMVALRDTARLSPVMRDGFGNPLGGASVGWQSLTPTVATVNASGRVEAVGNGRALIVATVGAVADTAVVRVQQRVERVVLDVRQVRINAIGFTRRLQAEARDRNGHRVPSAALTWSSADPAATVDAAGTVTARTAGTARVVAVSSGRADTATVQVQQVVASVRTAPTTDTMTAGQTRQFTASPVDSAGAPVPNLSVVWSSSNAGVASVDGQGRVRGLVPGTAEIRATVSGRAGSSPVVVRAVPAARVTLEPERRNLAVGRMHSFTATVYDAAGRVLTGRTLTWSSSDPGVATVDANGRVTAVAPGNAEVTVMVEGERATARVSVSRGGS
jgi:trimeric autotransporter adhesin